MEGDGGLYKFIKIGFPWDRFATIRMLRVAMPRRSARQR